jgi:outer membrane receptor protein involved in Fe transport
MQLKIISQLKSYNTKKYYRLLYVAVFAFSYVTANAQNSLHGIIKDEKTLSPLEKVTIELHAASDSARLLATFTNNTGSFDLNKINNGNYYILVKAVSYDPVIIDSLQLNNNNKVDIGVIVLKAAINTLQTVVISATKNMVRNTLDKQVYRADQFINAKGGTALDVLKNLPSVSVNSFNELTVRGSSGVQVMLNGKIVQGDIDAILNQLPANNIDNIELITAPSAKFDSNGKAGIINIITKKETGNGLFLTLNGQIGMPSFHTYGNHVMPQRYGSDATITYNQNKWSITAAVNYLRNDAAGYREGDVNTTIDNIFTSFPSNGERSFKRYTYSARTAITYSANKNNVFDIGLYAGKKFQARTAELLYNVTKTDLQDGSVIQQSQYFNSNLQTKEDNIYLGNFDYMHTFQNKSALTASVLYEYDDLSGNTKNLNEPYPLTGDTLQYTYNVSTNPLHGLKASLNYDYAIGKVKVSSGYQFTHNKQDGSFIYLTNILHTKDYVVDPAFTSKVLTNTNIHALYIQANGSTGKFEYAAGLRYEYSQRELSFSNDSLPGNTLTLSNFFPSASLLYSLKNKWKLKTAYSSRIQRAANFELNPFPEREHSETLEQGDANLLPEFVNITEAGFIKDLTKGSFFASLYYQHVKNPVQRVNKVYNDTILNRIYTNAGASDQWGLEEGLSLTPVKWLQLYVGGNVYNYKIRGSLFDSLFTVHNQGWVYSFNSNIGFIIDPTLTIQFSVNYTSKIPTAQGENSDFLSPNTSIKKTFMQGRLVATLQWQNMDMGLNIANRQRITTQGYNFYSTTNYITEPDVVLLNIGFNLKQNNKKIKLPSSEFGDKEF